MGQFLNKIRAKLGLEPRRDITLTGKTPNEVIVSRATQNESVDPSAPGDKPVVLAPMRMSPPTPSHGIVVDKAMQLAKAHGAPHHIILTRSHDVIKKKTGSGVRNPLTPDQKLKHAKRFFPKANIQMASEERPNLLSQAAELHQKGHKHLMVVAGSDRVSEYQNLLNKYNGEAGKHGYFNFPKISVVAAGEQRDAAASGAAGWSGTKSRETVEAGDYKKFRTNAVPPHVSDKHAKELYDDLHNGMGLNTAKPMNEAGGDASGYPVPAIPTRTARDFIGKKSPLNKLPPPEDKGNIGLDANIKDNDDQTNFELMRRRSKKRQLSVGFLEGYDDIEGAGALDTPKAPESNAPTTQAMKTSRIGGKRIKAEVELEEKRGLWDNIHAKRKRIKGGSGEKMRKPGSEGAPTAAALKASQTEETSFDEGVDKNHPIVKEYDSLKKHDIKTLRGMINQHHKVIDTSEFKTKDHAISHLLRQKHGGKKVDQAFGFNEEIEIDEATYKGKTVPLNKPMAGDVKKSKVYVDPDGDGKAKKVNFGDKTLSIKKNIPARKKSYCARSGGQGNLTDKSSANYWSRRAWNCEEIEPVKEAKATPYVKPHIENGKQVGYKSSDGYHVKYWRLADSALEKAKQHAKVDTVSEESLTDRVKAIMEGKK